MADVEGEKRKPGRPKKYPDPKVRRRANYEREKDAKEQSKTLPTSDVPIGVVEGPVVESDWQHPLFSGRADITRAQLDTWAKRDEKYGGPPEWLIIYRRGHEGLVNLHRSDSPQDVNERWIFEASWGGPGVYEIAAFRNQYDDRRGQMWPRESRRVRVLVADPVTGSIEPRTRAQQDAASKGAGKMSGEASRPMNEWEYKIQLEERRFKAEQEERRTERDELREERRRDRDDAEKREAKREKEAMEFRREERDARLSADKEKREWEERQERLRREYDERREKHMVDPLSQVTKIFETVTKVRELAGVVKKDDKTHWIERVITNSGDMLDGLGSGVANVWTAWQNFQRSRKVEDAAEAVEKAAKSGSENGNAQAKENLWSQVEKMKEQARAVDEEVAKQEKAREEEEEEEEEGDDDAPEATSPPPAKTDQPPSEFTPL